MSAELRRPRVVVVDDSRLDREMASDALNSQVRLELCGSAEEALRILAREPADLVLSEYRKGARAEARTPLSLS